MSQPHRSYEIITNQPDLTDLPFVPDSYIRPIDSQFSANQRARMHILEADGDQVKLYYGNPIAQANILTQENAALRLARERPKLYAKLAVISVIGYNKR